MSADARGPRNRTGSKNNRLAGELSPYLLQHATNPVDWYPWGDEAFERARSEDRPLFISIGYSTCHWCHVMERESFEDERVAALLNESFVCVKVDREERPDVDAVYMDACMAMTGRGGWPLTVFATPDREPFFAATYIPRETRFGMMGMLEVLPQIANAWRDRRDELAEVASHVAAALRAAGAPTGEASQPQLGIEDVDRAFTELTASFDERHGGFGDAPKFPAPHNLLFLMQHARIAAAPRALSMVEQTLVQMRLGGIYDHVGFGFHRYSTDARWHLPHFEKMLYDQALLLMTYAQAAAVTGGELLKRTACEVAEYVLRDMTSPCGGFLSAEDADSDGEEGRFYVWSADEFRRVVGDGAELFSDAFGIENAGNVRDEASGSPTGTNVLHLRRPLRELAAEQELDPAELEDAWETARSRLFEARSRRTRPLRDDKILTDWNGLMIAALAGAGRLTGESGWVNAAARAARFILKEMRDDDGRLLHRYRDRRAGLPATAADHANMLWGLLELHAATLETTWLSAGLEVARALADDYVDARSGALATAREDVDHLIARKVDAHDGAVPSANAVALYALVRLGRLTGDSRWEELAAGIVRALTPAVRGHAAAATHLAGGAELALARSVQIVIAGRRDDARVEALLSVVRPAWMPEVTYLLAEPGDEELGRIAPFTKEMTRREGAAAYVCSGSACSAPVTDAGELERLISEATSSS